VKKNCFEIANWLLKNGFDVNKKSNGSKMRAIDVAGNSECDRTDMISLLRCYEACFKRNWTLDHGSPVTMAMYKDNFTNMRALLANGADPDECVNSCDSELTVCITDSMYKCFVMLLEFGAYPNQSLGEEPTWGFKDSYIGMILSFVQGFETQKMFIESLMSVGASISYDGGVGTPFLRAIATNSVKWAEFFIESGCKLNFFRHDQGPTRAFGVMYFDFHEVLDMGRNPENADMLNKLLFGSGERVIVYANRMVKPHEIVKSLKAEETDFCLMSLCRKFIRSELRKKQTNLIYQVKNGLPLPNPVKAYLLYQ